MQLSSNVYELHCHISNFICNNQFLANFEMSQSFPFLMNKAIRKKMYNSCVQDILLNFISKLMTLFLKDQRECQVKLLIFFSF